MKSASIAEVQAEFNAYIRAAEAVLVVVTQNGKPVAVLFGVKDADDLERLLLAYSRSFRPSCMKLSSVSRRQVVYGTLRSGRRSILRRNAPR